jgi:hypothetical protein
LGVRIFPGSLIISMKHSFKFNIFGLLCVQNIRILVLSLAELELQLPWIFVARSSGGGLILGNSQSSIMHLKPSCPLHSRNEVQDRIATIVS